MPSPSPTLRRKLRPDRWTPALFFDLACLDARQGLWQESGLVTRATADGDPVGAWVDQSPAAVNWTAGGSARGTLKLVNGAPFVRLDGVSQFLARASQASTIKYAAFLFKSNAANGITDYAVLFGDPATFDWQADGAANGDGYSGYRLLWPNANAVLDSGSAWYNGVAVSPNDLVKPSTLALQEITATAANQHCTYLGNDRNAGGRFLAADLAFVGLSSTAPDAATQARLRAYLAAGWGPPMGVGAPTLLFFYGNSITAGGGGGSFPNHAYTVTTTKQVSHYVIGHSGATTPQLQTFAAADVYPKLVPGRKNYVVFVFELTNDLNIGGSGSGVSAATAYANLKSLCQALITQGVSAGVTVQLIVCTCLPRDDGAARAGFEADRLAVNALIRAGAVGEGWAVAVADFGADPVMGLLASCDDASLYADHLHPASAGHVILGNIAAAAAAPYL